MIRLGWLPVSWRVLIVPVLLLGALEASAEITPPEYKPGEVIIKFKAGASLEQRQAILADLGALQMRHFPSIGADRLKITKASVVQAVARYKTNPAVAYIEPNYILHADLVPNDPQFPSLWGMRNTGQTGGTAGADIRATQAWNVTTGTSSVLVAIIDTGVDYNHPDLSANMFVNTGEIPGNGLDDDGNGFVDDVRGWDFVNRDNDPMDDHGHGTHVSGTVGAVGNNGIGVVGVNWQVRLLPVKFLGPFGGSTEDAILSIDYAVLMGAKIINASWGGGGFSEALRQSILRADSAGTAFVAAAGNNGVNTDLFPHYPSSYDVASLVSVAATDHNDLLAGFSNFGVVSVDLAGPGVDILSTFPFNNYGTISGTSMATPHVAGALALIYGINPGIRPLAAKNLMLSRVDPLPSLSGRVLTGGRLNAFLPIAEADSIPPGTISSLAVTTVQGNRVELGWTATGDDGGVGTASRYDARYSTNPINSGNFYAATPAPDLPNPLPAGSHQTLGVNSLTFSTTYYFAIRAFDEFDNEGPVSNVVQATTLGPPDIAVSPASLSASLLTGQTASRLLTLSNTGVSELSFTVEVDNLPGAATVEVIPRGADSAPVLARGTSVSLKLLDPADAPPAELRVSGAIDRGGSAVITHPGPGRQVLSTSEEVFGSQQNGFIAGPRTRGNFFECTTGRTLREHRFYLDLSTSTQLWFLVYESMTRVGTYQLISASNASPSGPGVGWYSSGPVNVDMAAGRYYMIVASFEQVSGYFNQLGISPYPVSASFGSLIGGAGWTWAPPAVFPPSPSEEVPPDAFGEAVAYYQTLITGDAITWLAIEPDTGLVGSGSSLDLAVTFDAAGMNGGDYDANLRISSNDPDEPEVLVPAHLHVTGAPDIELPPNPIDFGPVFIGGERTLMLQVTNRGTDLLSITSVTASPSDFTVPTAGFDLGPGEGRELPVTYRPGSPGPISGSITVLSNDPDEPSVVVGLAGTGLIPPDINVTPTSVSASLLTGQQTTRTVTIQNLGGSDLTFTAEATNAVAAAQAPQEAPPAKGVADSRHGGPVTDGRGGPDTFGYQWKDSDEPGGPVFNWVEISGIGTVVPPYGDDWNFGPNPIGFNFSYYGVSYSSFNVCSNGWLSFTSPSAQYSTYPLPSPFAPENLLAAFWADLYTDPGTVLYHNDGTRLIVEWRNVRYLGGSTPFSFQILLYPNGRIVYQYLDMGGTQTFASVGIQNATRDDGLNIAFNTPYIRNGLAIEIAAAPQWLSVTPVAGTIPAGGQLDLEVRFDAAGMFGGDYEGNVTIASNDPDEAEVPVPAHLHVTGAPDIDLSTSAIDFGNVYVLAAPTESLLVRNVGTDLLNVTGIESSRPEYTVDPAGAFSLAPGGSQVVMVTFRPAVAGPTPGTLTVRSNDPDEAALVVTLAGNGVLPPDIAVAPESLSVSLLSGQTAERTLTISNSGSTNLDWALSIEGTTGPSPLSPSPTSWQVLGVVGPAVARNASSPGAAVDAIRAHYGAGTGPLSVLLYSDDPTHTPGSHWPDLALQALGLPYTAVYNDPFGFSSVLTSQSWDLVIVSHENFFGMNWNDVESHLAAGGRAVISTFDVDGNGGPPTTLWSTIGLAPNADLLTPVPIHWWDPGHVLFNSPESVPPMSSFAEFFFDDGDRVTALPGTDSPAGFVPAETAGQSAIVVSSNRSAIVNSFVLSENVSDLDYDGRPDAVELLENEIAFMMNTWLSADPLSGTVVPGSSAPVTVSFDATDLDGGDYFSNLVVRSNDPDEAQVAVRVHLHVTGVPDISVTPASLDFGSLFIGLSRTDSLIVSNPGHDLLVVSGITLSSADYSVSPPGGFTLLPRQSQVLAVSFQPSAAGPRPATLTLNSNDPDEAQFVVPLSGIGLVPPDIGVTPPCVTADLGPGQQTTRTVTIQNTGGSDLTFTAEAMNTAAAAQVGTSAARREPVNPDPSQPAPPAKGEADSRHGGPVTDGRGGPDTFGYQWKDSDEPGGPVFNWVEISGIGTVVPFFGDDWNYGPNPIGFNFSYYGVSYSSFNVCSNGWLSFTSGSAQYSTFPLPSQNAPENLLAAFWADLYTNPGNVFYHNDGTRLIVEWQNVRYLGGSIPFSFQILLYPNGRIVYQYLDMGGTQTYASVGIQNATRDDGLNIAFNTPYIRNGLAIEIAAAPEWLSVTPESGTIPAGGQLDLEVGFDATDLLVGDYEGVIRITSNDPDEPVSSVCAALRVRNVPILEVEPDSLAFGVTYVGYTRVLGLTLRSVGQEAVNIQSMTATLPEFTVDRAVPFSLAPGESTHVNVTFRPVASGPRNSTLAITSNALESPHNVSLTAEGLFPPVVGVTPSLLRVTAAPGGQGTGALHICNTGASVLRYSVRAANIPTAVAARGSDETSTDVASPSEGRTPFGNIQLDESRAGATVEIGSATQSDAPSVVHGDSDRDGGVVVEVVPPSWIQIDNPAGELAPGQCVDVTVHMDAATFTVGDYFALLHVDSNDPARPVVTTIAQLHVAAPVLVLFDLKADRIKLRDRFMHQRIEASITPTPPLTPNQIDVSSIRVNGVVGIDPTRAPRVEVHGGVASLVVWFRRGDLALVLPEGDAVLVTVTGIIGTETFVGYDSIEVRRGQVHRPFANEVVPASTNYTVTYEITEDATEVQWVTLLSSFDGGENWKVELNHLPNTGQITWPVPAVTAESVLVAVVEVLAEGDSSEVSGVLGVSGYFSIHAALAVADRPTVTALLPVLPNPSSGPMQLGFTLGRQEDATFEILDLQGRLVRSLALGSLGPGRHQAVWDGRNDHGVSGGAGIYFVRLRTRSGEWTQRVVRMN